MLKLAVPHCSDHLSNSKLPDLLIALCETYVPYVLCGSKSGA